MKPFPFKRRGVILNFILAALVISGAAIYKFHSGAANKPALVIRNADSGKIYGKWLLNETNEFAVEFIHSVNQSPVREKFRADNKMIIPAETRFYSFSAGMQSDLEEGQTMSRDGDAMIISGYKNKFKELNYIVGTVSDHILLIDERNISLRELCGRNAHISIYIK